MNYYDNFQPPRQPQKPPFGSTFFDSLRSMNLRRQPDRWIGGVASAVAYRIGWDPILVRGLFILFGLFTFGTLILLYGLAWALIPEASTNRIHMEDLVRGDFDIAHVGIVVMLLIGFSSLLSFRVEFRPGYENPVWASWIPSITSLLALILVVILLVYLVNRGKKRRQSSNQYGPYQYGAHPNGAPYQSGTYQPGGYQTGPSNQPYGTYQPGTANQQPNQPGTTNQQPNQPGAYQPGPSDQGYDSFQTQPSPAADDSAPSPNEVKDSFDAGDQSSASASGSSSQDDSPFASSPAQTDAAPTAAGYQAPEAAWDSDESAVTSDESRTFDNVDSDDQSNPISECGADTPHGSSNADQDTRPFGADYRGGQYEYSTPYDSTTYGSTPYEAGTQYGSGNPYEPGSYSPNASYGAGSEPYSQARPQYGPGSAPYSQGAAPYGYGYNQQYSQPLQTQPGQAQPNQTGTAQAQPRQAQPAVQTAPLPKRSPLKDGPGVTTFLGITGLLFVVFAVLWGLWMTGVFVESVYMFTATVGVAYIVTGLVLGVRALMGKRGTWLTALTILVTILLPFFLGITGSQVL